MLPRSFVVAAALVVAGSSPPPLPHCDTLDGPVAKAGLVALAKGDLTPALRWVGAEQEQELAAVFQSAVAVRAKGADVQQVADRYFLETLVRLHRAGEGEPYTGLRPAGIDLGPAIAGADRALRDGLVEPLVDLITAEVAAGIRSRFARAAATKQHADDSVTAGREFVAAYVEFLHFVERLDADARPAAREHGHAGHDKH